MLIGRDKEVKLLQGLLEANESQFVAVYGRRRVGKTFLIRETFNYNFTFQHTGTYNAPMKEQLKEFRESLYAAGMKRTAMPKTWNDASNCATHRPSQTPHYPKPHTCGSEESPSTPRPPTSDCRECQTD